MSKWNYITLGQLTKVKGGKRLPKGTDYESQVTKFPYLRVLDFKNNTIDTKNLKYLSYETANKIKSYTISSDDVYISIAGTIGLVGTIPSECNNANLTENAAKLIINNKSLLDKNYLVSYLTSKSGQKQIATKTLATSQPKLALFRIEEIEIPLPPLETQKQIAKTLDTVSELLAIRKQQLAELDGLIKAIFCDMFGDPLTNEKGWNFVELGTVAKLQGGYAFKSKDYVKSGVKLVQIANVHKDTLTWEETNYLSPEYFSKYSNYSLNKNDIVMAMTRPIIKSLDAVKIAIVLEKDLPCLMNQRVGRFQLNCDAINSIFLLEFCKSQYFKNAVDLFASNSLQPNVSSKQVESILCFLPPLGLQAKFARIVTKIEEQKALVKKAIDETQCLLNSLMSEYFD